MGGREAGDRKTAGESNPIPRGDRDTCKGWAGRDQALSRLLCAQLSRSETADLYELYKRLECFAVEIAVPQMSDRDIRRFENILIEPVAALQRGDVNTY